jgi:hypothetical protein
MIKPPRFNQISPTKAPDSTEQERFYRSLADALNRLDDRVAGAQADSTASTVGELVADFNALLAKLRTAGIMSS